MIFFYVLVISYDPFVNYVYFNPSVNYVYFTSSSISPTLTP